MRAVRRFAILALAALPVAVAPAAVPPRPLTVVANPDTPALSEEVLRKLYLGKVVEVEGRPVIPVNLAPGHAARKDFMEQVLGDDDAKFIAYWTVRRYIGKGSPPREFASVDDAVAYLRATPGAVGYVVGAATPPAGLKPVLVRAR